MLVDYCNILKNNKELRKQGKDEVNITLDLQCTLILEMMIKFYNLPWNIHKSKDVMSSEYNIPGPIMQSFLDKFTSLYHSEGKAKLVRTKELILKSFYYTIILSFILYKFTLNFDILCKALKIDTKDMITKLRVLNCKFPGIQREEKEEGAGTGFSRKKTISKHIVKLEAPLTFNIENRKGKPNKNKN